MRWKDLLLESQYHDMMGGLLKWADPQMGIKPEQAEVIRDIAEESITNARKQLRRKDRIVWYLRWQRFKLVGNLLVAYAGLDKVGEVQKLKAQYAKGLGHDMNELSVETSLFMRSYNSFVHYASLTASHEVQAIVWDRQSPKELLDQLHAAEQEWISTRDQIVSYPGDHEPTLFLDLGDGWAWYDLETPSCEQEAKAMGHCGNAGGTYGETVLSLRRKVADRKYRPSLTFILDDDGMLGEMKGRGNEKPNSKYHAAITALLKDPRIKGIVGGGYKPENNFAMSDLEDDQRKELQAANPYLRDLDELYDHWVSLGSPTEGEGSDLMPRILKGLTDSLKSHDYSYKKIDLVRDVIVVDTYKNPKEYMQDFHSHTSMVLTLFDEWIPKRIEVNHGVNWRKAENIAQACMRARFPTIFRELLPYDVDFILSTDMHPDMKEDGSIVIELPIPDYFLAFFGEDSLGYYPESLDAVHEGYGDSLEGLIENIDDPLDRMIVSFVRDCDKAPRDKNGNVRWPVPSDALVEAIWDEFARNQDDSFTAKDRDWVQPELNLGLPDQ